MMPEMSSLTSLLHKLAPMLCITPAVALIRIRMGAILESTQAIVPSVVGCLHARGICACACASAWAWARARTLELTLCGLHCNFPIDIPGHPYDHITYTV